MSARSRTVCLALATAAAAAAAAAGLAAGTLDQQQTDTSGGAYEVGGGTPVTEAQTFRAGATGNLDRVDVFVARGDTTSSPLGVQVTATTGGYPSGPLAAATVPAASIPVYPNGTWVSVAIGPVAVTAGTMYGIVLHRTATFATFMWWTSATDAYANGGPFYHRDDIPGDPWKPFSGFDFAFKTYVELNPTAIGVVDARARRTAAGTIAIEWRSVGIAKTLGFHVWRVRGEERRRITPSLILAARRGGTHRVVDRAAGAAHGLAYQLQIVGVNGRSSWSRPLRVRAD